MIAYISNPGSKHFDYIHVPNTKTGRAEAEAWHKSKSDPENDSFWRTPDSWLKFCSDKEAREDRYRDGSPVFKCLHPRYAELGY